METSQLLIMPLLNYKKAYNRVEWGFLEGSLSCLNFEPT